MKRGVGLLLLVLGVPMIEGGLAPFLPTVARPDLSLLVVLALAFCWRSTAGGLVLAAVSGFAVDLFSGGLLGQHALLRVGVFAAARLLSLHVNLLGVLAQTLFAGAATAAHAVGVAALTALFSPGAGLGLVAPGDVALHAGVNALLAPLVTAVVSTLVSWLGDEDAGRRALRLEPRSWAA